MRVSNWLARSFSTTARSWAAYSRLVWRSNPDVRVLVDGFGVLPGVMTSSSRPTRWTDPPACTRRAARRALVTRCPATGRARICTQARSWGPSPTGAPSMARIGSAGCSVRIGSASERASRSSPPTASTRRPAAAVVGIGGLAGVVRVCAPGQAASMARSIMPGGTRPGTHSRICTPSVNVSSKARCGCPPNRRSQPGRSTPTRLDHTVIAPDGSTVGGASTVTRRASVIRRWW
ncbi:hypothetical protein LX90_008536 [Lentzea flava]|nr:hypothetical protein [Lentzea flava]